MEQLVIQLEGRTGIGSAETKRLRRAGKIPSVVYSHGESASHCAVGMNDFINTARGARISQLFSLKSDDKKLDGRLAVVKEIQRDYQKGTILHIDLQAIKENEEITVRVPVKIVGEAPGVKVDGGILTVVAHELSVRCLPRVIPSEVSVDVSELRIGHSIHAGDLKFTDGLKLAGNPGETVVSVVAVRAVEEEAPVAGAAATDAAAPAAGAAPAAPAAADAKAEKGDKK